MISYFTGDARIFALAKAAMMMAGLAGMAT
jgi:hypothetical protein